MDKAMCKAVVIWLLYSTGAQAALSRLEALGMIESGNNDRAVGEAGEVSRYQILPKVWRVYSRSTAYANAVVASRVAQQHLNYLEQNFRKRAGREATDFDCYVMWNAGLGYYSRLAFSARRVHPTVRDRARRFVNLRSLGLPAEGPPVPATAGLSGLAPAARSARQRG